MINTSGFQFQNLARYTPVDPALVGFNPSQAVSGIGDALKLGAQLQQYQAKKQAMEEEAATRDARIAQANAVAQFLAKQAGARSEGVGDVAGAERAEAIYKSGLFSGKKDLLPTQFEADRLSLLSQIATTPVRTSSELAHLAAGMDVLPYKTARGIAENVYGEKLAKDETSISDATRNAKRARAERSEKADLRGILDDPTMADYDLLNAFNKNAIGQVAANTAGRKAEAEIGQMVATAGKLDAEAKRDRDPAIRPAEYELTIKRIRETPVADPSSGKMITLDKYISDYGPPDNPKEISTFWTRDENEETSRDPKTGKTITHYKRNPDADAEYMKMKRFSEISSAVLGKQEARLGIGDTAPAAPKSKNSAGLTADDIAKKWLQ